MNDSNFSTIARGAVLGLACGAFALLAGCSANSNGTSGNNGGGGSGAAIPLTANPSAIPVGGSGAVSLIWNHPEASSCALTGPGGAAITVPSPSNTSSGVSVTVNTATTGTYTYSLICTNSKTGAAETPDSTTVSVYSPATDMTLHAFPNPATQGSTTTLIYNHPNAASCSLTGTAPDGTPVTLPASTAGTPPGTAGAVTTPSLTQTGTYNFELVCKNSGGTTVNDDKVAEVVNPSPGNGVGGAAIPLTANPSAIPVGGSGAVSLIWNHPEASSCALAGPGGTAIAVPSPSSTSSGVPVTVDTTKVGTSTYTLACTNSSTGAAETPQQATVSVYSPATDSTLQVIPTSATQGEQVGLIWNHPGAASCSLTGTDPSGAAVTLPTSTAGTPPGTAGSVTTPPLTQLGTYNFELVCKNSSGTTVNDDKVSEPVTAAPVTVPTNQCNLADGTVNSTPLVNTTPGTYTESAVGSTLLNGGPLGGIGLLCLGCSTTPNPPVNAVNSVTTDFDTLNVPVGLLGATESLIVTSPTTFPTATVGQRAGFIISYPAGGLAAGVLQTLEIGTLDATGAVTNGPGSPGGTAAAPVKVQLLGLIGGANQAYASIPAPNPYNKIVITLGGVAGVLNSVDVNYACVADATTP